MDAFRYSSDEFFCEQVGVESIVDRFGTPTYVYSRAAILDNFRRFETGLSQIPSLICYSVKANSNLRILGLLGELGAGFDIVSGGELERVRRVGARPDRIVFSGVGKTATEIDAGLEANVLMFNVESAGELALVEDRARNLRKKAAISIRVNPDVEAKTHPYTSTGQIIHKFGVPVEEAIELYRRAAASEWLNLRGIACHIGSQILEVEPFLAALEEVLELASRLGSEGIAAQWLDLGGGFGIPYAEEPPLDFQRLAQSLETRLRSTPYRLILEPGRALVGNAGILVTRVLYVKRNERKNFIVVDAGMNDLMRPALYSAYHQILPVERRTAEQLRADVVGPLCETGDFIAQDRLLAEVSPGDLLAILTAGAYGYTLASNYNSRPRPAEVLVDGNGADLIRRRETQDDLMATERSG